MAKTSKKTTKVVTPTTKKKTTKKQATTKQTKKYLKFNKFSIYFQTASILLAIAGLTLNICDCIEMGIMLDLFGLSVISLAFSLFPERKSL